MSGTTGDIDVSYEFADLADDAPIEMQEQRGALHFVFSPEHYTPAGAAALLALVRQSVQSHRWLQNWDGSTDCPRG